MIRNEFTRTSGGRFGESLTSEKLLQTSRRTFLSPGKRILYHSL